MKTIRIKRQKVEAEKTEKKRKKASLREEISTKRFLTRAAQISLRPIDKDDIDTIELGYYRKEDIDRNENLQKRTFGKTNLEFSFRKR